MDENKLESLISNVITTFNFHGVKITNIDVESEVPEINITVSSKKRPKSLESTLDFAYWTLWSLFYGKYDESKSDLKISLSYKEVE